MVEKSDVIQRLEGQGFDASTYELAPASRMRRLIAARMTDTARDVPAFTLESDVRLDAVLSLRADWNAANPDARVSINDLVVRASALALIEAPDVNVSYIDDWVVRHRDADVCVVVAIPEGLMTPIVRAAQTKSAEVIAAEIRDLAARAQSRRLAPPEHVGGTFSVSNLGMYGVRRFTSIINPPQAAILSVGAGREESGQSALSVTLTCDHRAIDGVTGARWLQAFRRFIENPERLFITAG